MPSFCLKETQGKGACRCFDPQSPPSVRIGILTFPLPSSAADSLIPTLAEPKTPREPVDLRIPDNYVQATLDKQTVLPPVTLATLLDNIQWVSFLALTVTPALGIYGFATHTLQLKTFLWAVGYYFMTGMSITAGASLPSGCAVRELAARARARPPGLQFLPRPSSPTDLPHRRSGSISISPFPRLPPAMGSSLVQRLTRAPVLLCHLWRRRRRGLN